MNELFEFTKFDLVALTLCIISFWAVLMLEWMDRNGY